jgi:transposase-like protein
MVSSMPMSRPPYPEEFRREAVQMVRSGRKLSDVAASLGVTEQSLRTWVNPLCQRPVGRSPSRNQ